MNFLTHSLSKVASLQIYIQEVPSSDLNQGLCTSLHSQALRPM